MRLVLASSSPFRRMLMENAGLQFESSPAAIDEREIESAQTDKDPETIATILAVAKAIEVSGRFPDALVIGSDQTMSLNERVYHKPQDREEAKATLLSLSGKTHRLNSAIAITKNKKVLWTHLSYARLTVRPLSARFIDAYLDKVGEKALTSVGAYQLEGEGIQLFSEINGDYFTILGLPMLPLLEELRRLGAIDA